VTQVSEPPSFDTGIPYPARTYDYWLAGRKTTRPTGTRGDRAIET
jgi:hypothetical protein